MIRWIIGMLLISMLLGGCRLINEETTFDNRTPVEQLREYDAEQRVNIFEAGFVNGCMALIFFTAPSEAELMSFEQALTLCHEIRLKAGDEHLPGSTDDDAPLNDKPEVDCTKAQCI